MYKRQVLNIAAASDSDKVIELVPDDSGFYGKESFTIKTEENGKLTITGASLRGIDVYKRQGGLFSLCT